MIFWEKAIRMNEEDVLKLLHWMSDKGIRFVGDGGESIFQRCSTDEDPLEKIAALYVAEVGGPDFLKSANAVIDSICEGVRRRYDGVEE